MKSDTRALQILIIEEDDDDRDVLLLYLRRNAFDFEARFVETAEALQSALTDRVWDIVISDYQLPELGASEALDIVNRGTSPPPFILVSGFIGENEAVQALLLGAYDFIMKDNLARLAPAIRRALDDAAARQRAEFAQRALRENDLRFRTLMEIAPVGIYLTNAHQECTYVNGRWCEITGLQPASALGRDWRLVLQVQHDESASRSTAIFAEDSGRPLKFESHIVKPNRDTVWVIGQMLPHIGEDDEVIGHVGVIVDITDRKRGELDLQRSEKRLRELSAHIVNLDERQRASIAREIHDDIGSSLTGMRINLGRLRSLVLDQPGAAEKLADLEQLVEAVAETSVRIVRDLRPNVLDLGIVPAIEWQLKDFGRRVGLVTEFQPPGQTPILGEDEAVAVFRIVQEALNNIAKHAKASRVIVVMSDRPRLLCIEIRDNGQGLLTGKPERAGSFGVIGMRERIHSLGGWLEIESTARQGVTVLLGVPCRFAPLEKPS